MWSYAITIAGRDTLQSFPWFYILFWSNLSSKNTMRFLYLMLIPVLSLSLYITSLKGNMERQEHKDHHRLWTLNRRMEEQLLHNNLPNNIILKKGREPIINKQRVILYIMTVNPWLKRWNVGGSSTQRTCMITFFIMRGYRKCANSIFPTDWRAWPSNDPCINRSCATHIHI